MAPPAKTPRRGYSTDETEEIYNGLMFLANEFEEDNAQAVRCYEALCLKDLTLPPVPEAGRACGWRRCCSTRTTFTGQTAPRDVHAAPEVHGYEKLKCQTFSGLARCYRLFGRDVRMSWLNATTSGLDLARQAEKKYPDEREDWVTWQFHFMMDRADLYMVYCDFAAAERELAAGAALARETGMSEVAVAFALARLQRAIAQRGAGEGAGAGEVDAAKTAEDAVNALEEAVGEEAAAPARLHLHVLRTLGNLAAGNVHATAEVPKIVARLVKSIEGKTDDEIDAKHAYVWLPVRATIALAKLLTGESLRPLGKFSEARRDLEDAMDQCDAALKHLGVMPEGGDADAKAVVEQEQLIAEQRAAMEKEGSPSGRGGSKTSPRKDQREAEQGWQRKRTRTRKRRTSRRSRPNASGSGRRSTSRRGPRTTPSRTSTSECSRCRAWWARTSPPPSSRWRRLEPSRCARWSRATRGPYGGTRPSPTTPKGRCCTRSASTRRLRRGSRRRRRRRSPSVRTR